LIVEHFTMILKNLILVVLITNPVTYATAFENKEVATEIYSSIVNNNREKFLSDLTAVENLNVIGNHIEGESLMCAACNKDRGFFLQHLLGNGADPNYSFNDVSSFNQLPILCAISQDNMIAMRTLYAHGADLNAVTNPHLAHNFQRSILALAAILGRYEHAEFIMQRTEIDEIEMQALTHSINNYDYSQFPKKHALSIKFKEFLNSGTTDYAEFSSTYKP